MERVVYVVENDDVLEARLKTAMETAPETLDDVIEEIMFRFGENIKCGLSRAIAARMTNHPSFDQHSDYIYDIIIEVKDMVEDVVEKAVQDVVREMTHVMIEELEQGGQINDMADVLATYRTRFNDELLSKFFE